VRVKHHVVSHAQNPRLVHIGTFDSSISHQNKLWPKRKQEARKRGA
jgi:hypothetical protein